jgi:heat shock protein HslJ
MADALHDTSWVLIGPIEVPAGVDVVIAFGDGTVTGFSGCNRFRGSYRVDDEIVEFSTLGSTMMACSDEAMAIERDVLRRLSEVTAMVNNDGLLVCLDRTGAVLLEFAAQTAEGLAGDWVVNGIHYPGRQAIISVRGELTLTIEADRISGTTGCNRFNGPFVVAEGGLTAGPLMSTRRFCDDEDAGSGPTIMEQETALLQALEAATGHRLEGSRLTLTRPDGGISVSLHRP